MPSARPAAFGRRGLPSPPPVPRAEAPRVSPLLATDSGVSVEELSRRLGISRSHADDLPDDRPHLVPRSYLAALLAGLATACLAAGFTLVQHRSGGQTDAQLDGLAHIAGVDAKTLTPALLLLSLLAAGRATASTLMTAHFVLRRIGSTSLFAYVAGGAAAGAFWVIAGQYLGLGGHVRGLVTESAMGACAGFFYRLLAGARPAAAKR
ncbi:MAG TPA: hypothetical protein VND97_07345 [Beijerinckiaceae bacterium]|nr:hypothetical protein [Beijerinckiaceae bacterium]